MQDPQFILTHLVKMHVVPEVRVPIEFRVSTVDRATTVLVPAKDMDETVLDLLCTTGEIHKLA